MKLKVLPILILWLLCQVGHAQKIGPQKARQRAKAFMGATAELKLVTAAEGNHPAYYVFNSGKNAKGFVIVSGEDISDGILGYSEEGEFDPQNLPPALEYWLQCYSEQVDMIRRSRADTYHGTQIRETIEPLIKTKWNQNAPYNGGNPMNPLTNTIFPYTGCTATAMAQVLKYWAAPIKTNSIPSYTYYLSPAGNSYISEMKPGYTEVTPESLAPTTFNYDIMLDAYTKQSDSVAIDEVAKLLAYCGRAIQTKYLSTAGIGAFSNKPFSYFGFKAAGTNRKRSLYTAAVWDDLIYGELSSGRPVIYMGEAQSGKILGGHAFICDGYKDGLFHLNWGWGGRYNGYFKLSEANPHGTGSGGSDGRNGYSINQYALTGLQPEAFEEVDPPVGTDAPGYIESGRRFRVNKVTMAGLLKRLKLITLNVDITNLGTETSSPIYLFVEGKLETGVGVNIDYGKTDIVPIDFTSDKAGVIHLALHDDIDDNYAPAGKALWTDSIVIADLSEPYLRCDNPQVHNSVKSGSQWQILGNRFKLKYKITNNDSILFEDELKFSLFKKRDDGSSYGDLADEKIVITTIPEKETAVVEVCFEDLDADAVYWVSTYCYSVLKNGDKRINQTDGYYIKNTSDGIESVEDDHDEAGAPVYGMNGQRIKQPGKGIFIRNGHKYIAK